MIWPFHRKPKPKVIDMRCMNEDWKVGDLARCVDDDFSDRVPNDPSVGDTLRVTAIHDAVNHRHVRCYYLSFEGHIGGFCCTGFRKIRPVHAPAEEGFAEWLKGFAPKPTVKS